MGVSRILCLTVVLALAGVGLAARQAAPVFETVTFGNSHACAIAKDGALYCWGGNQDGQIGNGKASRDVVRPTRVPVGASVALAALGGARGIGSFSCALAADGAVSCWGSNRVGQLGDGGTKTRSTPSPVAGDTRFSEIRAGAVSVCGIALAGSLHCWGAPGAVALAARAGQSPQNALVFAKPTAIPLPPTTKAVRLVGDRTGNPCALADDGAVYCWTESPQGLTVESVTPPGRSFTSGVVGSLMRKCGITREGELLCWSPASGRIQLSLTAFSGRTAPEGGFGRLTIVGGSTRFREIAEDGEEVCAATVDGQVMCASDAVMQNLEVMPALTAAVPALTVRSLRPQSGAGWCALTTAGEMYCWKTGQAATRIAAPTLFASFVTAEGSSCAIGTDGAVTCWGQNYDGQLGDGTRKPRPAPLPVVF